MVVDVYGGGIPPTTSIEHHQKEKALPRSGNLIWLLNCHCFINDNHVDSTPRVTILSERPVYLCLGRIDGTNVTD